MSALTCPFCKISMNERTSHGAVVDLCPKCSGLWLDAGEFDAVVAARFKGEAVEHLLNETAKLPDLCRECGTHHSGRTDCPECTLPLGISCPVDGRAMYIVFFDDIELDRCPKCKGIWMDGVERADLGQRSKPAAAATAAPVSPVAPVAAAAAAPAQPSASFGDWGASSWESEKAAAHAASIAAKSSPSQRKPLGQRPPYKVAEQVPDQRPLKERFGGASPQAVTVDCDRCKTQIPRYSAWVLQEAFYCHSCSQTGELAKHVEGALLMAKSGSALDAKRAISGEIKENAKFLSKRVRYGRAASPDLVILNQVLNKFATIFDR